MIPYLSEYRITSPYGYRLKVYKPKFKGEKEFHTGVDLAHSHQYPLKAFVDGKVIYAQEAPSGSGLGGFGVCVVIEDDAGYYQIYAHCDDKKKPLVKVGDKVQQGQVIAFMGHTGQSVGSHLHFEVRKAGKSLGFGNHVEPINYLTKYFEKKKKTNGNIDTKEDESMKLVMKENFKKYVKDSIDNLAKKGLLNNPDDWKKKVDSGEIYDDLPMFTAVLLDRISDKETK